MVGRIGAGFHPARLYRRDDHPTRLAGSKLTAAARDQDHASGSSSCSISMQPFEHLVGVGHVGQLDRSLEITGPVSTPPSTKNTVTPNTLTP